MTVLELIVIGMGQAKPVAAVHARQLRQSWIMMKSIAFKQLLPSTSVMRIANLPGRVGCMSNDQQDPRGSLSKYCSCGQSAKLGKDLLQSCIQRP